MDHREGEIEVKIEGESKNEGEDIGEITGGKCREYGSALVQCRGGVHWHWSSLLYTGV